MFEPAIATCVSAGNASDSCACPAGFRRCAGRCLQVLAAVLNFTDSGAACAELGAHLAVPRSEAEHQCARDAARPGNVWVGVEHIGGVLVGVDGLAGPLPVSQGWWLTGEPKYEADTDECIYMYGGDWTVTSCDRLWYTTPLCQLKLCYRPECP